MIPPASDHPKCPRCGSATASLCGQSIQYVPAEWPDQPLQVRELHTLAYRCDSGLAFTQTVKGDDRPKA